MATSATTLPRNYVSSKFCFELEGTNMGELNSLEGGGMKTDVVDYKQGRLIEAWRQVGKPKFEDITLKCGMSMSPEFYKWIADFFTRKITRKSGALIMGDFNYKEKARRSFIDALISEVQFPSLDGGSKEATNMTVKLVAEGMTYQNTDGDKLFAPTSKQPNKVWHAANFAFSVDGYEESFKRVMKIDGFSIKQQILEYPSGHRRLPIRVPGRLEYPNLTVYIPAVDAAKVYDAVEARLIDYDAPPTGGMTGSLTLRAPDKSELCTITLNGVDIVSAEAQKSEASAETLSMVKVMIQCETMTFEYKAK